MKRRSVFIILLGGLVTILGASNVLARSKEILTIGAIPDQNPEHLNRLYSLLSNKLSKELKVEVKYIPVTNYAATVSAFRTGDLDLVWFGGLTGVQARLQRAGAKVLAQRDIDSKFRSVFIANRKANIKKISDPAELSQLKDKRFTFGSTNSTSGRLMPQYFLKKSKVELVDFSGKMPGFSGSHDTTIALVESGAYEVGALNKQVWESNLKRNRVDTNKVSVIWTTPPYVDYHWLAQPGLDKRFGSGFTSKLKTTLLNLNKKSSDGAKILGLFGANKFIPAYEKDYKLIEEIGREIGKIR